MSAVQSADFAGQLQEVRLSPPIKSCLRLFVQIISDRTRKRSKAPSYGLLIVDLHFDMITNNEKNNFIYISHRMLLLC